VTGNNRNAKARTSPSCLTGYNALGRTSKDKGVLLLFSSCFCSKIGAGSNHKGEIMNLLTTEELKKGLRNFTTDPLLDADLDELFHNQDVCGDYFTCLWQQREELGESFFFFFVELLRQKSLLISKINRYFFPEEKTPKQAAKLLLKSIYESKPPQSKEGEHFRDILKETIASVWDVVKCEMYRIKQITFIAGPVAMCLPLFPNCEETLCDLIFSHEILARGDKKLQASICHEFAHVLLQGQSLEFELEEQLAKAITGYLLNYVEEEKKRK